MCGIVCTHFPLHSDSFLYRYQGACINVHGHTHENNVKRPGAGIDDLRYFNVSVEAVDYTPVNHRVLIEWARKLRVQAEAAA